MKTHATSCRIAKPSIGIIVAFTAGSTEGLAGIPAKVVYVWPRFRSGDYLVTLEYTRPIKHRNEIVQHIDAFMSELQPIHEHQR